MKKQKLFIPLLALTALLSGCNFESFDKRCQREAEEYTEQQCPRRLDPCTILDSMRYDTDSRTLQYYYTLEGMLDSANVLTDQIVAGFRKQLKQDIINSVQLRKYKEEGINFEYIYLSRSTGKTYMKLNFTPKEYESK